MLQYYFIINVLLHVDFQERYSDNSGIIVAKIVITYDSQEIIEVGIIIIIIYYRSRDSSSKSSFIDGSVLDDDSFHIDNQYSISIRVV